MPVIINSDRLNKSLLRRDALKIIESAYDAIDIEKLVRQRFSLKSNVLEISDLAQKKNILLKKYKRIFVIGFGKGSFAAVSKMADILGKKLYGATSLDVDSSYKPKKPNKKVTAFWGTHPTPSKENVEATTTITSIAKDAGKDDLVIYFIGGGGSSLLCGSLGELGYSGWLFKELTKKGATINEINVVRKHISEVKGGNLAKLTYPAESLSLIVSDVCGNPLETIASGPTIYDKSTIGDALGVLKKYKISSENIVFIETPKEKKYFSKCKYFLLACNQDAALAMVNMARKLGYKSSIGSLFVKGEAKKVIFPFIKKIKNGQAMILAGETTVVIKGKGRGGRNQELALSVIAEADNKKIDITNLLVVSFNSDGFDNTPVAGAIADGTSLEHSKKYKLNPNKYLSNNDSFTFFKKTKDFIRVDRRAFNVADLMLILKFKKGK